MIYKPPKGKVDQLLSDITKILENYFSNSDIKLMGDFNVDAANESLSDWRKLYRFLSSFKLSQLISEPTRISSDNDTTIDHVWTNNSQTYNQSGVIKSGISDHDIIYIVRKKPPKEPIPNTSFTYRDMKGYIIARLNNELVDCDWDQFY